MFSVLVVFMIWSFLWVVRVKPVSPLLPRLPSLSQLASQLRAADPANSSAGRVAAPPIGYDRWDSLRALGPVYVPEAHTRACARLPAAYVQARASQLLAFAADASGEDRRPRARELRVRDLAHARVSRAEDSLRSILSNDC